MSVSHLHCKIFQISKIISAISFRLHLCLGSPTVANTRSKRRQDTWAQISWLGCHWKITPKIQEFFPFPISQHSNANLPPPAKGHTSTLFPQMRWTYIFYAWMGSHVIHSPLWADYMSNVTTDECERRWPDLYVWVHAQVGQQTLPPLRMMLEHHKSIYIMIYLLM